MKSKKVGRRAPTFLWAQPPNRLLWIGLICCLPWIIGARENLNEPTSVTTEQKVTDSENQLANPAAMIEQTASVPAAETVDAPQQNTLEPASSLAAEPAATAETATVPESNLAAEPAPVANTAHPVPAPEPIKESDLCSKTCSEPEPCSETSAPQPVKAPEPERAKPQEKTPVRKAPVKKAKPELAPPLCRPYYQEGEAPLRPINYCSTGMPPLHNGNFVLEALYWEGLEESLRYAMKNWTAIAPSSPAVNQKLGYDPGVRASIYIPFFDEWSVGALYTYFYSTPPITRVYDPHGDLFACMNFVDITSVPWQRAYSAVGKWNLKMNVIDLELVRPFVIGKSLMLQPLMGGKACVVRQKVSVRYVYSLDVDQHLTRDVSNARKIRANSSVWAVGPEVGCEMRLLIPKHFSLSLKGVFSAMLGNFSGKTIFGDYLGVEQEAVLSEKKTAIFEVGQVQCALSKWWRVKNESSIELMVGWETQVWWNQMRMNWWSTAAYPPQGSTLTVKGPFFKASWTF